MKVHIKTIQLYNYMHIIHINCNLPLLALYSIPARYKAVLLKTVSNLQHLTSAMTNKIKWEPVASYQYTVHVKVI